MRRSNRVSSLGHVYFIRLVGERATGGRCLGLPVEHIWLLSRVRLKIIHWRLSPEPPELAGFYVDSVCARCLPPGAPPTSPSTVTKEGQRHKTSPIPEVPPPRHVLPRHGSRFELEVAPRVVRRVRADQLEHPITVEGAARFRRQAEPGRGRHRLEV